VLISKKERLILPLSDWSKSNARVQEYSAIRSYREHGAWGQVSTKTGKLIKIWKES
jgi:hypothetical protein